MLMERIIDLLDSYQALEQANKAFSHALRKDQRPLLLPETPNAPDKALAIKALTFLEYLEPGETLPQAGVICASPDTVQQAHILNQHKTDFQAKVKAFRDEVSGEKSRLDKLIERVLRQQNESQRHRIDALQTALERAKLNRLNLLRCYAKVRVLPPHLKSISWTWAKTHSVIEPISREDALKQAELLSNEEAKTIATSRLTSLSPGQMLAYKKKLPNQLRANLVYGEKTPTRKAVTISGIALSEDAQLPPKWVWRDDPGSTEPKSPAQRLTRLDSKIEPEPYVKALHLHLYHSA